jgi:exodeoxyribonuclease VII small subunit
MEKEPSFEDAFNRLEEILSELEQGGLDLEAALTLFEEGVGLVQQCESLLDEAELQVEQLVTRPDGETELGSFR